MIVLGVCSSYTLHSISNRRYCCETYQDLFDYEEYFLSVSVLKYMCTYIFIYMAIVFFCLLMAVYILNIKGKHCHKVILFKMTGDHQLLKRIAVQRVHLSLLFFFENGIRKKIKLQCLQLNSPPRGKKEKKRETRDDSPCIHLEPWFLDCCFPVNIAPSRPSWSTLQKTYVHSMFNMYSYHAINLHHRTMVK